MDSNRVNKMIAVWYTDRQISVTASTLLPWALIGVESRLKVVSNEVAAQYCSQYYIVASS